MRRPPAVLLAATLVAVAAFALYRATLLPDFDFGDTASFQVMAGSPVVTPRDGYPLYFAVGRLFTWILPHRPALALNLASAAEGAVACGLFVLVAFELTGALAASIAAAAMFATSYTFWSQSVIAEVYALHICLVLGTMLALLAWERRPTLTRLMAFFALYAVSFGNHLSMVLLLPVYAAFLLIAAPGGWRTMVRPRVVIAALAIAAAGALQYTWNLHTLWRAAQPPASLADALATFWFDVTKADWRETMVAQVPGGMAAERLRMYFFDVTQQFGWLLPIAGAAGVYALIRQSLPRAVLVGGAFVANVAFALSYNVGDSHVFFLPSHLALALLMAVGLAQLDVLARTRGVIAAAALLIAANQGWNNFPALDRHEDERPTRLLTQLTDGAVDRSSILLTDFNWQVQNGLNYFAKFSRPDVAFVRIADVLLYAPALVRDNAAIGRRILLTARARSGLASLYEPLFAIERDPAVSQPPLSAVVSDLIPGTRYALCVLKPSRESSVDAGDLQRAIAALTGGTLSALPDGDYVAIAGTAGSPASFARGSSRPFRARVPVGGVQVDVRMESWLAFDTIRRMGFGQVVAAHHHTLIVERGVSLAVFDEHGRALRTAYAGNIFAAEPRYVASLR
ncbi:MAG TPA: DUF2723 domain-containing protein [Vicinamibacterales bacterium]|jgi:hypothetical protein